MTVGLGHTILPGDVILASGGDVSPHTVTIKGAARSLATILGQVLDPAWKAPTYLASEYGVTAVTSGVYDDAAHDQTAALQAAINAMPATGALLLLPPGNILLMSGITISGARITLGSANNQFAAQIITSSSFPAGDVLTFTGAYSGVDGLAFDVAATPSQIAANITAFRTSGYTVNLANGYGFVRNASFRGFYRAINMGTYAGSSTVRDCELENGADADANPGSGGIVVNNVGFGPDNFIESVSMHPNFGASTVYRPSFGIDIQNSGATQITNCDFTGMKEPLIITPGNGQKVEATVLTGNDWDGALINSWRIDPTGTGYVFDIQSDNDWFTSTATNSNGVVIAGAHSSGSGRPYPVMSVLISNALIGRNTGQTGTGLLVADAFSSGVALIHSVVFGFQVGALLASGASRVQIIDSQIGNEGFFDLPAGATDTSSRTNYIGIEALSGPGDYIDIHGNRIAGNTSAAVIFAATGTHNLVQDNPGYNPVGASAVTLGPSPATFTAGPTRTALFLTGSITSASIGGVTVCSGSGSFTVLLAANQSAVVTYSGAAPTAAQNVH